MISEISYSSYQDRRFIESFIRDLGDSENSFRYFNSRNIDVIKNHLLTIIFFQDDKPVGYGHLDKDSDKVWLGIAIIESHKGKGYGHIIMEYLINKSLELQLPEILLSVDQDNSGAIHLYEKFKFQIFNQNENTLYFKRELKS